LASLVPEKSGVNSTLGINPSTQDFVTEAANSNMLEIESSKLVAAKGDARHKAFKQMIKDHTATSAELKTLVGSGKVQVNLPAAINKAHAAKLNSLSGADFIKAYEDMQVSAHKDAVSLFELPAGAQHDLFEAAVRSVGEGARQDLAPFLHWQHPRTIDGDKPRQVPEPDSLGG
jgi:predicted outer membrane protein